MKLLYKIFNQITRKIVSDKVYKLIFCYFLKNITFQKVENRDN